MDLQLIAALLLGITTVVVLVLRTRFDAFIALLLAALVTALVAGVSPADAVSQITTGFGNTLASIGIVIGLGVMIGKLLEVSGAADALALAFVRAFGRGREEWAMAGTGYVVSIPVFCDSGYVIMHPLSRSLARRTGRSFVMLALALGVGMTLTHHLVPPTPGPLAVAGLLGADLGGLILSGAIIALLLVPVVVAYARWVGPRLDPFVREDVRAEVHAGATVGAAGSVGGGSTTVDGALADRGASYDDPVIDPDRPARRPIGALRAFLPLLVPLVLIVGNTVSAAVAEESTVSEVLGFVGNPVIALLVGAALAIYTLVPRETSRGQVHRWLAEASGAAGLIILITGAGGALGTVLRESGIGDELAETIASWSLPGFVVPFLIATFVRLAQGSGTVAMITAASVTAPIVPALGVAPLVAALACCAGSMVFSYFNDSYFWVVTRFTGLEGKEAIRGWSGITTVAWAGSIPLLVVANFILG